MTVDHVLGHLAQRFAISEENVATEALTWILRRSEPARRAISRLARTVGVEVPDDLSYVGQVGRPESGRPDIVGLDDDGHERLLIEAKFAAHLTDQQPNGYLTRLPDKSPGALLIVAPHVRISSLWVELLQSVPELRHAAPSASAEHNSGVLRAKVTEHKTLVLVSWRELTALVLDACTASGQTALAHDAEQLVALTEVMDSTAFTPTRPGDYSPHMARQVQQLEKLIDDTWRTAKESALLERNGNSSHGRIFYGWYLRSRATQKSVWFGFSPVLWNRFGRSPLWAKVAISTSWSRQRLQEALSTLNQPGRPGVYESTDGGVLVPLLIPHYAGESETVAELATQLQAIALLLDVAIPADEDPVPDDPASLDASDIEIPDTLPVTS